MGTKAPSSLAIKVSQKLLYVRLDLGQRRVGSRDTDVLDLPVLERDVGGRVSLLDEWSMFALAQCNDPRGVRQLIGRQICRSAGGDDVDSALAKTREGMGGKVALMA